MKVLLSIKPEYAEKIFSGEKKFEYRKSIFKNTDVSIVVVYATMPIGRIIGEFTIAKIHRDSPDVLWENTKEFSGISKTFYQNYFRGRNRAYAIEVDKINLYSKAIDPYNQREKFVAPQSFKYLA